MYAYKYDENKYCAGTQDCQLDPIATGLSKSCQELGKNDCKSGRLIFI